MRGKSLIERVFDIRGLQEDVFPLLLKYFSINALFRMITNLTSTIYILYFFDNLGFEKTGIIIAIGFLTQSVFDFPTGVLSDRLGQKKVLLSAYFGYIVSLMVLSFANSFYTYLLANTILALALAQQSGALETWFDNKYKKQVDNDPERTHYGTFLGKAGLVSDIFGSLFLLLGGYLVLETSRKFMFQVQAMVLIAFTLYVYLVMDEEPTIKYEKRITVREYGVLLKKGFSVILSSVSMFFFILGIIIYGMTLTIFGDFILFPSYRGYVGDDFQANVVRFATWCFGTIFGWIAIGKIKTWSARKTIPKISIMHDIYLFFIFGSVLYFYPLRNTYVAEAALLTIFLISSSHTMRYAKGILIQRMYLDLVPDEQRNSFYSLMPTLTVLITAPVAIFAGYIIENYDYYLVLYILGFVAIIGSILMFLTIPSLQFKKSNEIMVMEIDEPTPAIGE